MKDITTFMPSSISTSSSLADYYNSLKSNGESETTPYEAVRTMEALCKVKKNKKMFDLITKRRI